MANTVLYGTATTGLGKGAKYIGMDAYQELFNDALGFYPFPGTLNIEVDTAERAAFTDHTETIELAAPTVDGETYSAVDAHPVTVTAPDTDKTAEGALLDLEITDHPDTIAEIIAPVNLREELGLEDEDTVECRPRKN